MKLRAAFVAGIAGLLASACSEGPMAPSRMMSTDAAVAVAPTIIAGNPVCTTTKGSRQGLGYLSGTDDLTTSASNTYTITVPGLGDIRYTTNADNTGLASWSADFPIDAVLIKGGNQGANSYAYDGATSGADLLTSDNIQKSGPNAGQNNGPAGISHLNFCWYGRFTPNTDPELGGDVDAAATYTRDYDWNINKSANAPASVNTGATLTVSYTVDVTRNYTDSEFAISGTVNVANTGYAHTGSVDGVTVDVGGVAASVSCPVSFPAALADGESFSCSYSAALPNADMRTVTASVAASGLWRGTSASTDVSFGAPTTEVDEEATISDSRVPAGLGTIAAPKTFSYDLSFGPYAACVPVTIDNTASFLTNDNAETASSTASVNVNVTGCNTGAEELGTGFAVGNGAQTFTSLDSRIKRWGWSLNFGAQGTKTYDVYVGAGQNNLSKGTRVGTVTIAYIGNTVTATYNLLPGYVVMSSHLYAGSNALPQVRQGNKTVSSVAPGQYTINANGGAIWVIAHSVIGYVQP